VEIVYEHIAFLKKYNTEPVLAFWDKKCLNFGRNWEEGFLIGLLNAKVVILLVSEKVHLKQTCNLPLPYIPFQALDNVKKFSTERQDNVLLEYLNIFCFFLFFLFCYTELSFDMFPTYEVALLQSKIAGTHVLPVFVGEETILGNVSTYAGLNFATACAGFPDGCHKRGDDAKRIIHDLR
jgi:hypothetical protein